MIMTMLYKIRRINPLILFIPLLYSIPVLSLSFYSGVLFLVFGVLFSTFIFFLFCRNATNVKSSRLMLAASLFTVISLAVVHVTFINLVREGTMVKTSNLKWRDVITKPRKTLEPVVNEKFYIRKRFIHFYNRLFVFKFGISPMPERVILGKYGTLIYADENVIEDYRCTIPFTEQELEKIRVSLEDRNEYLNRKGIKHFVFIAPNMHTIYPENLPWYIKKVGKRSRFDQLIAYMRANSNVEIIDARDELLERKKADSIWYKTDTHWNELGAFVAYDVLINAIKKSIPTATPLKEGDFNKVVKVIKGGDLAMMLDLAECYEEKAIFMIPASFSYSYEKGDIGSYIDPSPGRTIIMNQNDSSLPRMVMFRDSFAAALIPYLSQNFSRSAYFWTPRLIPEIIEKEKPDLVITEVTERYIRKLAN